MITGALSLEKETRFEKKQIESLVPCPIIHGIAHLNNKISMIHVRQTEPGGIMISKKE